MERWNTVTQPLGHIMFRDSLGDMDSCNHVYQRDRKPYQLVFDLGFEARHQANTQVEIYFNLKSSVNSGERPLDPIRDTTYGFISNTHTTSWRALSYPAQAEIVFPASIAPQYIRSAQPFMLTRDGGYPRLTGANNILYKNRLTIEEFPQQEILRPATYYRDNNTNMMKRQTIEEFPHQEKRE
ncbi:hypothetical protein CTI12_AA611620 [Artemisia annua]|uniref:Uncharacterized protein n=1 Tax=Artemisia annua TaxID=35608 RepID=A0A2U1KEQ2_ARTAN|nr:hypothetical protein CTI12_AA611620 [Artemisia annua]